MKNFLILFGMLGALAAHEARSAEFPLLFENNLGLSIGLTNTRGDTAITPGFVYEYKPRMLERYFGIGPMFKFAMFTKVQATYALGLFGHPWRGVRIFAAPGLESQDEETRFLIRAGAGYDIAVLDYLISPLFYLDFIGDRKSKYFGVMFVIGF